MMSALRTALKHQTDIAESVRHVVETTGAALPRTVRLEAVTGDAVSAVETGVFEAAFRDLLIEAVRWCDYDDDIRVQVVAGTEAVRVDVCVPSPGPHLSHLRRVFDAIGVQLQILVYLGRSTTVRLIIPRRR